jgi:hypothetical protein
MTSNWGGGGGYLDFAVQDISNSKWVAYYWVAGTCLSGVVLLLSIFYITVEVCYSSLGWLQLFSMTKLTCCKWCQQSFLSTDDYKGAMAGLQRTRKYRAITYWFRAASRFISKFTVDPLECLCVELGLVSKRQETLVWTKQYTHDPPLKTDPSKSGRQHVASPSIELTIFPDSLYEDITLQETPAMAHSLFPPAHTTRRARNESDASLPEPNLPIYERYRSSEDSNWPLIQRPSDVHRSRAAPSGQRTQDRRRSSEISETRSSSEYLLSPEIIAPEHHVFGEWPTVQSRQGYRRANSDPGIPPVDLGEEIGQGLEIGYDGKEGNG